MTTMTTTTRSPADVAGDALVLATVRTDRGAALASGHDLPSAAVSHLRTALTAFDATGEREEVVKVAGVPGVKAATVVLTGLGEGTDRTTSWDTGVLRDAAGSALRAVQGKSRVVVALPTGDLDALAAVADGAHGGAYAYVKPAAAGASPRPVTRPAITLVLGGSGSGSGKGAKAAKAVVARAVTVGEARDWARDLVNTPPNLLYPQSFAEQVKATVAASSGSVKVSVLDDKALAKGGFGGIVGVGQGSANPPRIVTMSYSPRGARGSVALVGKGITFDSGGLCIKPAASMATMKSDMAGAAAVAAAVVAAAELELPVAVTGYLCLAENMPGSTAQRPGDVVTMRNTTTVEIIDTDAEGRMVLADGICLAAESTPDVIVDIATLTGAQMVALGPDVAGFMGNDDAFRTSACEAAARAGEHAWPMPLPTGLRKGLDSPVADLAHKADRWGGMLTAGIFLSEFVPEGTPWAHLDIAGPSFNEKSARGINPKGGTGYGVATLVSLIEAHRA